MKIVTRILKSYILGFAIALTFLGLLNFVGTFGVDPKEVQEQMAHVNYDQAKVLIWYFVGYGTIVFGTAILLLYGLVAGHERRGEADVSTNVGTDSTITRTERE